MRSGDPCGRPCSLYQRINALLYFPGMKDAHKGPRSTHHPPASLHSRGVRLLFLKIPAKGPASQTAGEWPQVARDMALEPLGDENVYERRTHQPVFKATVEVQMRGAEHAPGHGDFRSEER